MSVVRKALYRGLLKAVGDFERNGLPCLGLVQQQQQHKDRFSPYAEHLDVKATIRGAFRTPLQLTDDDAFRALRSLRSAMAALQGAEEETRVALCEWRSLLLHAAAPSCLGGSMQPHAALRFAQAAEEAALQLASIHSQESGGMSELNASEDEEASSEAAASAGQALDNLAEQVRSAHPGMFPAGRPSAASNTSGTLWTGSAASHAELLEALSTELLRGPSRLKNEPVEWVYDGLSPLMLPDVVRRRKGVPLSLALAYCSVAWRLGVPAVPLCATAAPQPLEILAKKAGRASIAAPSPDQWIVACPTPQAPRPGPPHRQLLLGDDTLFVDVGHKGRLLGFQQLQQHLPEAALEARAWGSAGPLPALASLCSSLVRAAMVAHQRRGESDSVVHYMYQLMALDPAAPEWERAMQPAEISTSG